jgi:hypothetical protein
MGFVGLLTQQNPIDNPAAHEEDVTKNDESLRSIALVKIWRNKKTLGANPRFNNSVS